MELRIYRKPANLYHIKNPIPKGSHITVTRTGSRLYFCPAIVEQYKMLTYPPVFALTSNNEWAIMLGQISNDAFPLQEHKNQYFFHFSDIIHRILRQFDKQKIHFQLKPTQLPHVFILKEYIVRKKPKRTFKPFRDTLAPIETSTYYDTLMKKIMTPEGD